MTPNPLDMLQLLSAGVRRVSGGERAAAPSTGQTTFAQTLTQARQGTLESGVPVRVASGAGVELSDGQLARLAQAADRAEAAGATRALVLIDGMALRLEVGTRTISGRAELPGAGIGVIAGVDAVVSVPAEKVDAATRRGTPPAPVSPAVLPPSLAKALQSRSDT